MYSLPSPPSEASSVLYWSFVRPDAEDLYQAVVFQAFTPPRGGAGDDRCGKEGVCAFFHVRQGTAEGLTSSCAGGIDNPQVVTKTVTKGTSAAAVAVVGFLRRWRGRCREFKAAVLPPDAAFVRATAALTADLVNGGHDEEATTFHTHLLTHTSRCARTLQVATARRALAFATPAPASTPLDDRCATDAVEEALARLRPRGDPAWIPNEPARQLLRAVFDFQALPRLWAALRADRRQAVAVARRWAQFHDAAPWGLTARPTVYAMLDGEFGGPHWSNHAVLAWGLALYTAPPGAPLRVLHAEQLAVVPPDGTSMEHRTAQEFWAHHPTLSRWVAAARTTTAQGLARLVETLDQYARLYNVVLISKPVSVDVARFAWCVDTYAAPATRATFQRLLPQLRPRCHLSQLAATQNLLGLPRRALQRVLTQRWRRNPSSLASTLPDGTPAAHFPGYDAAHQAYDWAACAALLSEPVRSGHTAPPAGEGPTDAVLGLRAPRAWRAALDRPKPSPEPVFVSPTKHNDEGSEDVKSSQSPTTDPCNDLRASLPVPPLPSPSQSSSPSPSPPKEDCHVSGSKPRRRRRAYRSHRRLQYA